MEDPCRAPETRHKKSPGGLELPAGADIHIVFRGIGGKQPQAP
jgi:hypothetical protein